MEHFTGANLHHVQVFPCITQSVRTGGWAACLYPPAGDDLASGRPGRRRPSCHAQQRWRPHPHELFTCSHLLLFGRRSITTCRKSSDCSLRPLRRLPPPPSSFLSPLPPPTPPPHSLVGICMEIYFILLTQLSPRAVFYLFTSSLDSPPPSVRPSIRLPFLTSSLLSSIFNL